MAACDAEIERLLDEARQQRPWPVRAQAAADALRAASAKRDGLRTDLEAAKAAVTSIAAELAAAEADWTGAQASMGAVKAEVRQGAEPQPGISQQDEEVLGALRGMVASTGLPVQNLLTALYTVPLGRRWARPEAAAWVAPPLRGLRRLAPEMQSTRPRRLPPGRGALPHSPSRLVTAWRSRASQRLRRRPRLPRASRWHRRSRCRAAPQKSKSKRRRLPGRGRDNEGCRRQSCEALLVWCGGLVPEGQLPNGARGC